MFIKKQMFKNLLKQAYKGKGLEIGNDGEGIWLNGSYWEIWIRNTCIPKEYAATIIEIIGEIPEGYRMFDAQKDGNQERFYIKEESVMTKAKAARLMKLTATQVVIETNLGTYARVLQGEHGDIKLINEQLFSALDKNIIWDAEGEHRVEGPFGPVNRETYWYTNHMAIMIMPRIHEDSEKLIGHLEKITIEREKPNE